MRRKRSPKEAQQVKNQLAEIIKDTFDNNGALITHEELALTHVTRNASLSAADDVQQYGGVAAAMLRRDEGYAIVPVTGLIVHWTGSPANEEEIANTLAGVGAGGPRIGWYQPTSKDDWLWVFYIGHLAKAAVASVFHVGEQVKANPKLTSAKARAQIDRRAVEELPAPPSKPEKELLLASENR